MRTRFRVQLLAVLAVGAAVHAVVIALTPGEYWDIYSINVAGATFAHSPLHVYRILNVTKLRYDQGVPLYMWPYLPAYLPVAAALHWAARHVGSSVSVLDRSVITIVDLLFAFVLQWGLGRMGQSPRRRLAAAALVALGPAFVAVAAVHGQLDAVAWLSATAGFMLWMRRSERWHPLACGVLVGLGISIKVAPGLALLALAPTARDRRELGSLLGGAAAVVALTLVPFALTTTSGLGAIAHYSGFPGRAGLTALFQPRLTLHLLAAGNPDITFNGATKFLLGHASPLLIPVLVAIAVIARWRRLDPADTMVTLIFAFYVFAPAVLPQYWLWAVPFLILAGRMWAALLYQLALLPLLVAIYAFLVEPYQPVRSLSTGLILHGYVPYLWVLTLAMLAALLMLLFGPLPTPITRGRGTRVVGLSS